MLFKEWHSNLSESVAGGPATGRLQVQVTVGFGTQSESMRGRGRNKSAGLVILPFYGGVNLHSEYTLRAGRLIKIIKLLLCFLLHRFATSCKLLSIMADQDPQTKAVW